MDATHREFQAGTEFYQARVGGADNVSGGIERTWELGAHWWSPAKGGLRILRRDQDLNSDGYKDVVLCNNEAGGIDIFWNGTDGFSRNPTFLSVNPYNSPQAIQIADLNTDGHPDILVGTGCYSHTSYIFYGTDNPQVFERESVRTDYNTYGEQDVNPVDLNGDGYLDLWMACNDNVFILYGPDLSYRRPDEVLDIPGGYYHRQTFADLNNDGYLDAVMGADNASVLTIAYGPEFKRRQTLRCSDCWKAAVCDLNDDGFLDLALSSTSGSFIYWGSEKGFLDRTQLAGSSEGNSSIADLNNDGIPDIVINHINGLSGMGESYVYYGPDYADPVTLPGGSVVAADYDNDGFKDLLMFWYRPGAKLFWNNKGGFSPDNYTFLPCVSEDGVIEELGNLWDRSNKERFQSRIHDISPREVTNTGVPSEFVAVYGSLPSGVGITAEVRGSWDGKIWSEWETPTGEIPEGAIAGGLITSSGRFFQYRLVALLDYAGTALFAVDSVKSWTDDGQPPFKPATAKAETERNFESMLVRNGIAQIRLFTPGSFLVSDVAGRLIKNVRLQPGSYTLSVADARGVYVAKLVSGTGTFTQKAVLTR